MIVYQLAAKGKLAMFAGEKEFRSFNVFRSREVAESRVENFKTNVIKLSEDNPFACVQSIDSVRVVELELED